MTIKIRKFSSKEEQSKIPNYLILPLIDGKFTPISDLRIIESEKNSNIEKTCYDAFYSNICGRSVRAYLKIETQINT